mmetsp:Transcript_68568/g.205401  ORF Transcript_68568/g.205401 Transcript_68568/m.205401 type:complete len:363 (-) Transcript_68568:505-1593(-)
MLMAVLRLGSLHTLNGRLQERQVADAHQVPLHSRRDTIAAVTLETARLWQRFSRRDKVADAPLVTRHQAAGERVIVLLLDSCRPLVESLLGQLRDGLHPEKLELARGERPSLIEPDDTDACERLQRGRALYEELVAASEEGERCALHKWRRAKQGARAARDDHDEELVEALVEPESNSEQEDDGRVPGRKLAHQRLRVGERTFGFVDRVAHSRMERLGNRHLGLHLDEAHGHERSRRYLVPLALVLRHRLASDAALVERSSALDDDAIGWDCVAHTQDVLVANRQVREQLLRAARQVDRQRCRDNGASQFAFDGLERENLDQIHEGDERTHARSLDDVALQKCAQHRDHHHDLHVGTPPQDG